MDKVFLLILGAALSCGLILYARRTGQRGERAIYAMGLIVAALIYVGFAVAGGGLRMLWIELLGLGAFTAFAVLGRRSWSLLLAFGWAAHVAWDLFRQGSEYVPGWYPTVCISFDLLLAFYIASSLRQQRSPSTAGRG